MADESSGDPTDGGREAPPRWFTLSIARPYVELIIRREKLWEFRQNPRFGAGDDAALRAGDVLFLVATEPDSAANALAARCRVGRILRGEGLAEYFGDPQNGHWMEAGCRPDTPRDWLFFSQEILSVYAVAVEMREAVAIEPIPCSQIVRHGSEKPWTGTGLCGAEHLKRFRHAGRAVAELLTALSGSSA